jgi:nucleoside-diphosphate-sugar epimerase
MPRIAITGANGYLGKVLSNYLSLQPDTTVVPLVRRPENALQHQFTLGEDIDPELLYNCDALIHAAWDMRTTNQEDLFKSNVAGSFKLFEQAMQANVKKIIFISSISAFQGCSSLYGRTKLMVEERALEVGACVLRPGLICGNDLTKAGGMLGNLAKLMDKSFILPCFYPDPLLYTCRERMICRLITSIIEGKDKFGDSIAGIITVANDKPVTFSKLLGQIGNLKNKKLILIPVPWRLIYVPLIVMETLKLGIGFKSDSLLGLMYTVPQDQFYSIKDPFIISEETVSECAE